MGYENATSTILMASHCIMCGKPLVDPESVERGMGPDCSEQGYLDDGTLKAEGKRLIHDAAEAATNGDIVEVRRLAGELALLGYLKAAEKIRTNFVGAEKKVKIHVEQQGDMLHVAMPFKRAAKEEFIKAWQSIPGRHYDRKSNMNVVPITSRVPLWGLMRQFCPGVYGKGPKGVFRVPRPIVKDTDKGIE